MNDTKQDRSDGAGDAIKAQATTLGNSPTSSVHDDVRASAAEGATGEPGAR
ncbi:hypothetical protein [Halapricum hydrolyticum]|uniref:Uncharacterized protein n=1 Tax=Halapricum hydrolyticum TaxID=2979991 RepID=A0AAE3LIT7_9EURY|nr:hypothetical protein [Halapricum hydrolyticum]MCU4717484.1 hypothetical protein [Halapricum hydrolyticum]MCU4726648.1 hypothetical protein [Halapricum hydrolyticum]